MGRVQPRLFLNLIWKGTRMKALEFLNQTPPVIRDNFNRDSSAIKSRDGFVIHSGVHRSTAFVSDAEAISSLEWSKALGQPALNGWIEATISEAPLEDCEQTALQRAFPAWKFLRINSCGNVLYTANKRDGKFETRISGRDWREIGQKIN